MAKTDQIERPSIGRPRLFIYLMVAFVLLKPDNIGCSPGGSDQDAEVLCDDIPEAIYYIYEHLPDDMSLDDKCVRYAVMTSMIHPKGRLHNKAVVFTLNLPEDQLLSLYHEFNDTELGVHYMTAIDGFRAASMIGPPFIELVECLKRINVPFVQKYLSGEELSTIIRLYRQVQESPTEKAKFEGKFNRAFLVSLLYLFGDHIDSDSLLFKSMKQRFGEEANILASQIWHGPSRLDERQAMRRERRQQLAAHRHREQERLRGQRLSIVNPDTALERSELRKQHRRMMRRKEVIKQKRRLQTLYNTAKPSSATRPVQQVAEHGSPNLVQPWKEVAPVHESVALPEQLNLHVSPHVLRQIEQKDNRRLRVLRLQQQRDQLQRRRTRQDQSRPQDLTGQLHSSTQVWAQHAPVGADIHRSRPIESLGGIFVPILESSVSTGTISKQTHRDRTRGRRRMVRRRTHEQSHQQENHPPTLLPSVATHQNSGRLIFGEPPSVNIDHPALRPPRPPRPPQPLVNPMTPFPRLSDQIGPADDLSPYPSPYDPPIEDLPDTYVTDSITREHSSHFDYERPLIRPVHHFEDTDEVVQSIITATSGGEAARDPSTTHHANYDRSI